MHSCEQILEQARVAAGGHAWTGLHAIKIEGTITAGGMSGPYEQVVALDDGRFTTQYALGPAKVARGYDGATAWQRSPTGEVAPQNSAAAMMTAATEAYVNARAYWTSWNWPATFEAQGTREHGEGSADLLRIVPEHGHAVELWWDTQTHFLDRVVQEVAGKQSVRRYSDYRQVGEVMLPFRIATGSGDPRHDIVIELRKVTLNPFAPAILFAMPPQAFDDFHFIDGTNSTRVPVEIANNHVYLTVTINGQAFRLMLDTGGVNMLTPEAVARAGLQVEGALEVRGPGEQSVTAGFARIAEFLINDALVFKRQLFRVMPLPDFHEVEGTRFDGLLGYEVFKRLAVQIDYARCHVTLMNPDALNVSGQAVRLALTFFAHLPAVCGDLDGMNGQFWLDTGNRNALTLWRPFVSEHELARRYVACGPTTIGWGIGGSVQGVLARAGCLTLGTLTAGSPVLSMPSGTEGPTATQNVAGNIGGEFMRRYVVTFDYSRHAVYFLPTGLENAPYLADRSGMWVNMKEGVFIVKALLAEGPAAEAGLHLDDLVLAIDAASAATVSLDGLRRMLCDPGRRSVLLGVARGALSIDIRLQLRDSIPAHWSR